MIGPPSGDAAEGAMIVARHHLAQSRPHRALETLKQAEPKGYEYWEVRALALHDLEHYAEAADAARRGLREYPDSPQLLVVLASALTETQELAEAEQAILSVLAIDSTNPAALCLYARMLAAAGQLEKARRVVELAREYDPADAAVLSTHALVLWTEGRDRDAGRVLREVLAQDPEHPGALSLLSVLDSERGAHGSSYRHMRTVLGRNPTMVRHFQEHLPDAHAAAHPLLAFARPFMTQYGRVILWFAVIIAIFAAPRLGFPRVGAIVAVAYLAYCAYSWGMYYWLRSRARKHWR